MAGYHYKSDEVIKFTIITPTLLRDTLKQTIDSVDMQTYDRWEHIIIFDGPHDNKISEKITWDTTEDRRMLVCAGRKYNNFGNSLRHKMWKQATGNYVLYMDDDDTYHSPYALEILAKHLQKEQPEWAVFNALRLSQEFFHIPPGKASTMSNQFVHKKYDKSGKPIRWPDCPPNDTNYYRDGEFIESLVDNYEYKTIYSEPLVKVDYISRANMIPGIY